MNRDRNPNHETAEQCLRRHGFVECDMPACNCGSWHPRHGYFERFNEIKAALEDAGVSLDGVVLLDAVKSVLSERAKFAEQLAAARADQERLREILQEFVRASERVYERLTKSGFHLRTLKGPAVELVERAKAAIAAGKEKGDGT